MGKPEKKEKKDKKDKKDKKVKKEDAQKIAEAAVAKKEKKEKKEKKVKAPEPVKEKKSKKEKKEKKAEPEKPAKKDKKDKKEKKREAESNADEPATTSKRRRGNDWSEAHVGGAKRQEKFEKLMGAHKHHEEEEGVPQEDTVNRFNGQDVEQDRNGDLLVRKGQYQIYLPAKLQKQSHNFTNAINQRTAKEIESDLLKQDEAARLGRKSRGKGLGFGDQPKKVEGIEINNPDWKPLQHTTYDSDSSSSSSSSSS